MPCVRKNHSGGVEMRPARKKARAKESRPRWSRRSFGKFALMATGAAAVCRPKLAGGPVNISTKTARYWKGSEGKDEN